MNNEFVGKLEIMPLVDTITHEEIPNLKVNFVSWFLANPDPMFHIIHLN